MTEFEPLIRALTVPRDGAYSRPWMTDFDPDKADVLIVGASSAKKFLAADVGNHQQFLDALWNRNGRTCRAMYNAAIKSPSRTRPNLDRLSEMLAARGLTSLQTNVTCASAPYDAEVSKDDRAHGTELFKAVVEFVPWKVMIVYGIGASKRLGQAFGVTMPPVPPPHSAPVRTIIHGRAVYVSPTLAAPAYHTSVWPYLERVVATIADGAAALPVPSTTRHYVPAQRPREEVVPSDPRGIPGAFKLSAANQLVWRKMHAINASSGLRVEVSTKQAALFGGPKLRSTDRVFRHRFDAAKADLLVREDVFLFDARLQDAVEWTTHTNPGFQHIRTHDLQLLDRILNAVEAFAVVRAP